MLFPAILSNYYESISLVDIIALVTDHITTPVDESVKDLLLLIWKCPLMNSPVMELLLSDKMDFDDG